MTFVRDGHGRFTTTLPTDERCPLGLGNRTGYHRGCHCSLCTAANTTYMSNHRKEIRP
jgi:hypothetical protein